MHVRRLLQRSFLTACVEATQGRKSMGQQKVYRFTRRRIIIKLWMKSHRLYGRHMYALGQLIYRCSRLKSKCMHMYVYTCIHVDIYTYTHRYTYIHCIHKCIYLHKATCESVISTKFANATTLPPMPRACLMSVKASVIKQNIRRYSRILNHNKQMRIASFVLQHYGFKQNYVKYR